MGKFGLRIAKLFGRKLPEFSSMAKAEANLFKARDENLRRIAEFASQPGCVFVVDFTPASLKRLEEWYFSLCETFGSRKFSRDEFERCMGTYFCEVAVRNCPEAKWLVQEYAFEPGKYEIGVQRGLVCLMGSRFNGHYKTINNKRREKIYRDYQKYFA